MKGPSRSAAVVACVLTTPIFTGCGVMEQLSDHPNPPDAGADDIVWQVSYGGLPIALSGGPSITVYGDGRFLVPHVFEQEPDPSVVTTFDQGHLSDPDLASLQQAVADSHVLDQGAVDLGDPAVMDASTVTVRGLGPAGTTVELDAYALGLGGTEPLTDRQVDLRNRLDGLLSDLADQLPDRGASAYDAERLRVYAYDTFGSVPPGAPHTWPGPLHTDLFGGLDDGPACAVIAGPDVPRVLEAAVDNPDHTWTDPAGDFYAVVTVALPGEPACPH